MNKNTFHLVLIASVLMPPALAFAKPTYPARIQSHLALSTPPPSDCLLCHGSKQGGGPVVQPFGKSMVDAGLTGSSNQEQLGAALDKLAAASTDSDGDGVPDIEELKAGSDPNPSGEPIQYGCGQIAPHGPMGLNASALAFLASILYVWRSSRRVQKASNAKESDAVADV
jgi:hypothetical protein